MDLQSLQDKLAVVTGASSGIGEAAVEELVFSKRHSSCLSGRPGNSQ